MTPILNEILNIIKESEGFRSKPYLCPAGVYTIGYGHTDGVTKTDRYSREYALEVLLADLKKIIIQIDSLNLDLNAQQTNALASFIYNVGFTAFKKSSIYAILIDSPACIIRDVAIARQLKKWVYCTQNGKKIKLYGLVKRRNKESDLFMQRNY